MRGGVLEIPCQRNRLWKTKKSLKLSEDISKLIDVLQRLCSAGNTLLVIEHNLELIKCADYLIEMGPEGGDGGGNVVFAGTTEEIIEKKESYTGKYLKGLMR